MVIECGRLEGGQFTGARLHRRHDSQLIQAFLPMRMGTQAAPHSANAPKIVQMPVVHHPNIIVTIPPSPTAQGPPRCHTCQPKLTPSDAMSEYAYTLARRA